MATKQSTVSITVSMDSDLARIFEEICIEEGKRPEEALVHAVRSHVGGFLDTIARGQDPSNLALRNAMKTLMNSISRKALARALGADRWPWVMKGAPASLKAAKAAAVRRGKRQAAKFAEQDRMLGLSKDCAV